MATYARYGVRMETNFLRTSPRSRSAWKWTFFILLVVAAVVLWLVLDAKKSQAPSDEMTPSPSAKTSATVSPRKTASASPRPTGTVKPTTTPISAAEQSQKNAQIEQLLFQYTNSERAKSNLPALTWDSTLYAMAKAQSQDMVTHSYFSHTSFSGKDPWQRAADYGMVILAENIAKMGIGNIPGVGLVVNTPESVAQAQFKVWMGSEGHRTNILGSQVTWLGIGTAFDGSFYLSTQEYR